MKRLVIIALCLALLPACSKEGPLTENKYTPEEITPEMLATDLAASIAKAQSNGTIRSAIKHSILDRFDGDYNVLFVELAHKPLGPGGFSFLEALWKEAPITKYGSAQEFLALVEQHFPLLQLSLPELSSALPEDWKAERDALAVTVAPPNHGPQLLTYDKNGETCLLEASVEPSELTLVIGSNERTVLVPTDAEETIKVKRLKLYWQTKFYNYYQVDYMPTGANLSVDPNDCCTSGGGTGAMNCPQPCQRDCRNSAKDLLVKMRFHTAEAYDLASDGWLDGKLEMELVVCSISESGLVGYRSFFFDIKEKDAKGLNWINLYRYTEEWPTTHETQMQYWWIERSWGFFLMVIREGAIEGTTPDGSPITRTATINLDRGDASLGFSTVEYCDDIDNGGKYYSNGSIDYYLQ